MGFGEKNQNKKKTVNVILLLLMDGLFTTNN